MTFDDRAGGFRPDPVDRDVMGCPWDADPGLGEDGSCCVECHLALRAVRSPMVPTRPAGSFKAKSRSA